MGSKRTKARPDFLETFIASLPAKQRLAGLSPEQRLAGLSLEQRLAGLSPKQRAAGLDAEQRLAGLDPEQVVDMVLRLPKARRILMARLASLRTTTPIRVTRKAAKRARKR